MTDLDSQIAKVQQFASSFKVQTITSDAELQQSVQVLGLIKDKLKRSELLRKEFTGDLNAQLKKINDRFKEISVPLESLEKGLKLQVQIYYAAQERKAREDLERMKKEKPNEMAIVEAPSSSIKTVTGTASIKKVWTFEVENINEVPREYFSIDEKKIREAISSGKREISGVRIFQESQVAIR
jgi:hypothetical protein